MKKFILFYRENTQWFHGSWQHLTKVFKGWCKTSHLKEVEFNKNWFYRFTILLLVFGQVTLYSQSNTNNSQWGKNGPASAPASPVNWANGNAQATNSHFTEGQSIPTRIELAGLTPNVPASVTFNINIIQGSDGQHAFDFFTGPNRIEEIVSPLDGLVGYNPVKSTYLFPIPNAGNTGGVPASHYNETALKMACQQNADAAFPDKNSIWIYNGTVSNITYVWGNEDGMSTQQTYCTVTFTPTSAKALLVLGCHIAAEPTFACAGWGVGNGASTISGSPYHFHIDNICSPLSNCVTLGSQDQQMASNTIIVPPTCSITPSSAEICAGATAIFTASGINGSGGAPYTFAWTGPNGFSASTASITVGVAGTYSVIVSDSNGVPAEAPCTMNLVVNDNPVPSVADEEACVGSTATFSTTSTPGYSYQWYLNNVLIPGATNNNYTTPALALGDNGGVYKVIVIDGNHGTNCDGEDSGILTVNALPTVVANDAEVCTGFTVQLTANPAGGTWSGANVSASGLFDASGLAAGPYNVTYTYSDANECTNSDGAVVTVNALPTVVANDAEVCTGFTVQLTANPAGGTWSGANVSASGLFDASGLAAGPYNVTYTYSDANECTNSDGAVVTVNALPTVVANDAEVCTGFTVQLTANPAGGTWSGANVSASGLFDASGLAAGPYNVTYTYSDANECTNSDGAVVTVNALPTVVANDAEVCTGFTVQLTANPAGGTWSGANVSASGLFDASGLAAGPYNVTYTYSDANECTNSDGAVVTVNALPTVVANDAEVCTGFTVQLTANPAGGTWSGANVSASGLFDASGLAAGPYNVTYTYSDANECTNSDGAVVTVNALPTVVANDAEVCTGFTVQLTANPAGGTWSGANVSASGLFDASGLAAGPYNVTYTYSDANECTNSDGAVVTVNALPTVVANDAEVCTGFTVQLTANPAGGTWSGANVSASGLFDASGLAAGPYNVTYTYSDANECTNSDSAVVSVNALPTVIANDAEVCTGFTVQLTANPAGGTWSGANVSASGLFDASGLAAGPYNVTYTYSDANECTNSDGAVVTVNALPTVVANDAEVCTGFTVQLTANPAGGTWSGANVSASGLFDASGLAAGPYNVTYTYSDSNECTNSDGAVVTVNALPTVVANDAEVCTGFTVQLTANPAGGTWSGANVSASGLFDASGLAAGPYNVTYTYSDANECTNSDGAVVAVNALPTVVANDAEVCTGFTVQLTANPAGGTWSGANVSASGLFDASGLAAGPYNVTYTYSDANECTNSDSAVVTVNALPTVVANDTEVCAGFTVQLTANPAGGTWSGANVSASGLFDASGLAAGPYNVTYTYSDANECTNSDGAVVTVNALPTVVANDAEVCTGFTVQLTANPAGGTWSGANVSASGLFDASGLAAGPYNVTYTYSDSNECTNSDGAVVTVNNFPEIVCPSPALFDVNCGVSASVAQAATDSNFNTWFNSFAVLNSGSNIEIVGVQYEYSPVNADPDGDSNAPLNPIIGVPGSIETSVTVTWTIRNTETGCESSCSSTFTMSFNCRIGCQTTSTPVACNGEPSGSIQVLGSNGIPPYNFYLYNSSDLNNVLGSVIGVNDEPGGALFSNLPAGNYTILITDAVQTLEDATACDATITQPEALSLSLEMQPENCVGTATGSISATFSGGVPPYIVSIDNGTASEQLSLFSFTGLSSGNHIVKIVDANGCELSEDIEVELIPCDNDYCTYTQGFYGNYGGLGCTQDLGVVNSQIMMRKALELVGGSFDFGSIATGNYFTLRLSDVIGAANPRDNNIYKMLPGGGNPRRLVGFATYDMYSTWSDNDPLTSKGSRKGAINNNLLSQTMTLFFNIQVDGGLGGLDLEATFATAKTIECGSNIPNMETVQVFSIPQSVINYLNSNGGATVGNLFILANKALGGENIGGLSHSNINAAVDAINRGYDECRIGVPIPEEEDIAVIVDLGDLNIISYPNPFKEFITLNYQFNYDSSVTIQIYDTKGTLLYNFEDKEAYFGKEMRIDINFNHAGGELYILKLMTNKEVVTHKIVSGNQ